MLRRLVIFLAMLACLVVARGTTAQSAARLDVILVLDASGSMAGNDPQKLVRVASKMLSDLADERDRVTVMSFGSKVTTLASASGSEHEKLRAAIDTLGRTESCTDYLQALDAAAGKFGDTKPGRERRVVLFLTDGRFEPVDPNGSCGRFEGAGEDIRKPIEDGIERAAARFKKVGARVFTIGLGNAPTQAADSARVLRNVATITDGQFLHAKGPRDVPKIFADIFGGLVGAPVMQRSLDAGRQSVKFSVPKGADRLHVVLVPDSPADLDKIRLSHGGKSVPFEPIRREERTQSSYRLARVNTSVAGDYELTGSGTGRVEVLVIPDVGLSLVIEGVPDLLPEGAALDGKVALRTRLGDRVKLAPEYLSHVTFTVQLQEEAIFDGRPDENAEVKLAAKKPLKRGKYVVSARASHGLGFLSVDPVSHHFSVEPRFSLTIDTHELAFDTMAEEGELIPLTEEGAFKLVAPKKMPVPITMKLTYPSDMLRDMFIEPTDEVTFGPGKPREHIIRLKWKDARALRTESHLYSGIVKIEPLPAHAKLLVGKRAWELPVKGKLREWTLMRWLEEYKWELLIALGILLLIIYAIGRFIAQTFPPKARIHYVEVGQEFESDSLIKRYARHGAYRNAKFKFPLGKKARPLVHFQSTGAGFMVLPAQGTTITILDELMPETDRERRKPFKGYWEQRYRLGDRYEVWLTRSGSPDAV